jgi:hypothetical protein
MSFPVQSKIRRVLSFVCGGRKQPVAMGLRFHFWQNGNLPCRRFEIGGRSFSGDIGFPPINVCNMLKLRIKKPESYSGKSLWPRAHYPQQGFVSFV